MVKHIHWSQLLETHPLSDKVTRLFLTLKFQFQFFLSVSSTLMLRDLAVRWPGTFKGPSSGPATFKRLFISQCHFQGTIQRTDTAHKIALQELDQQTSRSTLQLWCGGTWWSDDLALLLDLTIFLCIRKISWRRQRRQWCWWSATRDVTATQCTRARPQSALVLGYTCLDLPRTKPLPSLIKLAKSKKPSARNLSASMNPYITSLHALLQTALSRSKPCISKGVPAGLCRPKRAGEERKQMFSSHCLLLLVQVLHIDWIKIKLFWGGCHISNCPTAQLSVFSIQFSVLQYSVQTIQAESCVLWR